LVVACLGAGAVFAGLRRRRKPVWWGGLAAVAVAAVASLRLLAVSAFPTTYAAPPLPYAAGPVVRGAALYASNCVVCHGAEGHGDGPAAASLPMKPTNLAEHALHHRPGELFWWVSHGIPGTPMPAFAARVGDTDVWSLVQFLRAQSNAEEARTLTARVGPWRPIEAPDFTFERARQAQESLVAPRARPVTLVVFYTLPQSLSRLEALGSARRVLASAGLRIIAVPAHGAAPRDIGDSDDADPMFALVGPDVAKAYALFARREVPDAPQAPPEHAEFLIDGDGFLRARWISVPHTNTDWLADLLRDVQLLKREPPHPHAAAGHVH
jgi:mono/diheme cytochrome c family protein